MPYACASLSCSRLCCAWHPSRAWSCLVTSDAYEALFGCDHFGSISGCQVASYIPFPFHSVRCYAYHVCSHHLLAFYASLHSHMFMHESCLLVCRPYFNTMKSWTLDPNLHFSLAGTPFCVFSLLVCPLFLLVSFLAFVTCHACHIYRAYLLYASFICTLHLFLPLLVYWFLFFTFACTHMERGRMERGCMELGHGLPSASKKDTDASM